MQKIANDLYWTSGDTVDQIARQLGISRNTMYSSVHPIPAGSSCVHCDEPLLFTNRTARSARTALCPVCEIQVTLGEDLDAASAAASPESRAGKGTAAQPKGDRISQFREELSQVPVDRAAKIGGAAALGVAIGAAAAKVLRKG